MADLFDFSSLADVTDFQNGKSLKKNLYSEKGKHPIYGSNGVINYTDEKKYELPVVVIGRVGAYCGSIYLTNGPAWVTDNAIVATTRTGKDIRFLYYLLKNLDLGRTAIGSAQPLLTQSGLNVVKARLAPQFEREAIASVLGVLDDKIENNRRINETLEEMARAMFKSWFVDFDPVHAKAAGNAPAHMDADTAALFPSSFGDDGLPAGWLELPLSDMTTRITKGTTPTKADLSLATNEAVIVNFLKVNMVTSDGVILKERLEHIPSSIHLSKLKRSILKKDDILYSIAGTIGRVASVSDEILPANTNQALAIISPNTNIVPAGFIRLTMSRPDIQSNLNSSVVQGVQANLGLGIISNQVAVFPPVDQIFTIFEKIRLLLEKKQENQLENQTLIELRDTLLPKLMSGEIRVADAEREVEAL